MISTDLKIIKLIQKKASFIGVFYFQLKIFMLHRTLHNLLYHSLLSSTCYFNSPIANVEQIADYN
ncbi:hypothetical protein X299_05410 [Oenococcus oeni IOEB_S277]|nr:hypothetical protein X299_05410 [Oenococcus oeni IOEB_S277]